MNDIIEGAKEELKECRYIIPKAILDTEDGLYITMMKFNNDEEKEDLISGLFSIIKKKNCKQYYIIQEGWVSKFKKDRLYVRPKRDADRKEAIIINNFNSDRKNQCSIIFFKRDNDDNIIFEEEEINELDDAKSIWNYWADQKKIDKEIGEKIQKHNEEVFKNMSKKLAKKYVKKMKEAKTDDEKRILVANLLSDIAKEKKKQMQRILEDPEAEKDL